jgi:cell wall-associated protease
MSLFNRLLFPVFYLCWLLSIVIWLVCQIAGAAEPLRVAVIDTGLDRNDPRFEGKLCAKGHYNFVERNEDTKDEDGHGTYIAGLITKYAHNASYCLLIYKFYNDSATGPINSGNAILALKMALKEGAHLVNMSFGGPEFQEQEYVAIKEAPTVLFIAAAGNEGKELKAPYGFYPASYELPNIVVVGATDSHKKCSAKPQDCRLDASNYGTRVTAWEQGVGPIYYFPNGVWGGMVGTSISTAIYTGRLTSVRGVKK